MSRVVHDDVSGLPDPIISHNFNLIIPNIPRSLPGSTRRLNIACTTATLPGSGTVNPVLTVIRGHTRRDAGRKEQEGTFNFSVVEGVDMALRQTLLAWSNTVRDLQSQSNLRRRVYAVPAYIEVIDGPEGQALHVEKMSYFWLGSFNEVELDGEGASSVVYQCSGVFDLNFPVAQVGD